MSRINRRNNAKQDLNTGLNTVSNAASGRFFNKDGSPNVVRTGGNYWENMTIYQHLLRKPLRQFMMLVLAFFLVVNLVFTLLYYAIGIEHLGGLMGETALERVADTYFFSVQTFTTVGYGRVNPIGFVASALAGLEALVGILSAALATGLLYGRFSRPRAYLKFSDVALISPYQGKNALMFRLVPYTSHSLTEVNVTVRVSMKIEEDGKLVNKFYTLPLELDFINSLFLSWTLVHVINEDSPLFGQDIEDFQNHHVEIMVQLRAFDEIFGNTVFAHSSYTGHEIVAGGKFRIMFRPDTGQTSTVVDLDLLHIYDTVPLPIEMKQPVPL